MSVQSVFRRSVQFLKLSNSPSCFIGSLKDLHSNGWLGELCSRGLLKHQKCINLSKLSSLQFLACQQRNYTSQASTRTQTTIGISSGNLAEQVVTQWCKNSIKTIIESVGHQLFFSSGS